MTPNIESAFKGSNAEVHLGNAGYSRAAGIALSGNWHVAPAWRLSAAVGSGRIFYETFLGDGNMYITQVGLAHALGRATLLRADGAFRREAVDSEAYSWREFIVGLRPRGSFPGGSWQPRDRPTGCGGMIVRSPPSAPRHGRTGHWPGG